MTMTAPTATSTIQPVRVWANPQNYPTPECMIMMGSRVSRRTLSTGIISHISEKPGSSTQLIPEGLLIQPTSGVVSGQVMAPAERSIGKIDIHRSWTSHFSHN